MYDKYNMNTNKLAKILQAKKEMLNQLSWSKEILVILYEEPEGSPRPRARLINKSNLIENAKQSPNFIQVYSLTGASDRKHMSRIVSNTEFNELSHLIYTPCKVLFDSYFKTPSSYSITDTYLAEMGLISPISKPDFDNISKKYADMYNSNVWIDDALVVDGEVRKFYSILPRVEIRLQYLNMLYNKKQYDSMVKRVDDKSSVRYFDTSLTNLKEKE